MKQANIEILEQQRSRIELFFRTGTLTIAGSMSSAPCEKCIDVQSLVRVMREEFERIADLNPYEDWDSESGYKGFLSRLYAHYDKWKAENEIKKPGGETGSLNTIQSTCE